MAAILFLVLMYLVDVLLGEKVLLVSMDGFRWDYTQKTRTPNFDRMASQGSRTGYVVNTFMTETFPCHYSIATGLYEESHGIVGNEFYDPHYDEYFNMTSKETKWWNAGEPIWVTARKQGLKSAVYYWPGSETEIKGFRPNIWKKYDEAVPFDERIDTVIEWLSGDIDLALLYFHEPDYTGHVYGTQSTEIIQKIEEMDILLGSILDKLDDNKLTDKVNIIVTSDHGMTDMVSDNSIIVLSDHIDLSMIKISTEDIGPVMNILPHDGHLAEVFIPLKKVPHMSVYLKDDIPDKWHYKHSRRILPLLLVAEEGWLLSLMIYQTNGKHNRRILPVLLVAEEGWLLSLGQPKHLPDDKGVHGYDNQIRSMNPIFYSKGPSIRRNILVDHINSVDIYSFISLLLGIQPAPNNGSLDVVMQMVKKNG